MPALAATIPGSRARGGQWRSNFDYYGKADGDTPAERIAEATSYFAQRLHETAWTAASDADREKALIAARGIIDALNYKGVKHSVYTVCGSSDHRPAWP